MFTKYCVFVHTVFIFEIIIINRTREGKPETEKGKTMQVKTFTITNSFNQKERREAQVVLSIDEVPVGFGKVGTTGDYNIYSERSARDIQFAKMFFAVKR